MPELPEVETMRRGVLPVVGCRVAGVEVLRGTHKPIGVWPRPAALARRVTGQRIVDVGRVGKRVVLALECGDRWVFEPRMTGLVLLAAPPNWEHLRLRVRLSGRGPKELLYWDRRGLGLVRLCSAAEFARRYLSGTLGPDALEITDDQLRERLGGSRREVKVALLDQAAVAGIGNLYAAEILHLAAVHPQRRCCELTLGQWRAIGAAVRHVLQEAIRYEGSTLSDGTYRNALNEAGGYQNHHRVYDREGQTCVHCGRDTVRRIVQAQRSTFFCPTCQPRRGSAAGAAKIAALAATSAGRRKSDKPRPPTGKTKSR